MASSPSLGPAAEIFSQVIIEANDNANGLLSLSTSAVSVEEQRTEPFLYVNRTAGSFGEVCQLILTYADCFIVHKLEFKSAPVMRQYMSIHYSITGKWQQKYVPDIFTL